MVLSGRNTRRAAPSTSDLSMPSVLNYLSISTESDFDHPALYVPPIECPESARSLPTRRFHKNIKEMTGFGTTEEEFDALPIAVRRKFFSTRERLHIAQNSRSNALSQLQKQSTKNPLAERRGMSINLIEPRRSASSSRRLRNLTRQQPVSSNEASWFLTLPEKIKKKQFTQEEQVILAARLRESVILDAADEAIYKASRRASRNLTPLFDPSIPSRRASFESDQETNEENPHSTMTAMYESFRWMDEERDLDLKLCLDDYHANLDGVVIPDPESLVRPSFRRKMSISKMPFGRSSISSLQPRSPQFESPSPTHPRQKSRTLSLISPKHAPKVSISSIDPNAAHYQDPEARLKLRVYLASPQKFDEAIEFGFPSLDAVNHGADKENNPPKRISKDATRRQKSFTADRGQSFLNEDSASLFEDDVSMGDPESPITPLGPEMGFQQQSRSSGPSVARGSNSSEYPNASSARPSLVKHMESYSQAMAGSREMTLRMTLTRPDLRSDESMIYGWQTSKSTLREEFPLPDEGYEVKGPFGGTDGWGPLEKENSVVKRLWNRVSRSQKKIH